MNTHPEKKVFKVYNPRVKYEKGKTGFISKTFKLKDYPSWEALEEAGAKWFKQQKDDGEEFKAAAAKGEAKIIVPMYKSGTLNIGMEPVQNDISLKLDEKTGNSILLVGSSKMGKSTLLMHLQKKYFTKTGDKFIPILFSDNPHIKEYAKSSRSLLICSKYTPALIKEAHAINKHCDNKYKFCFMLDDIIDESKDEMLKKLILTYRNANISSIVSLQWVNDFAKNQRCNVNNICLFGFNTDEGCEQAIKKYLMGWMRARNILGLDAQIAEYKKLTADHGFLYIHPASGAITHHRLKL